MFTIGAKTYKNEVLEYLRPLVINKLKDIEKHINQNNFKEVYDNFNDNVHISRVFGELELEPYFEKFKETYDIVR